MSDFGVRGATGAVTLPTERRSIMNSGEFIVHLEAKSSSSLAVVWIGKILGCAVFEPLLERLGYKKIIYVVCLIQIIGIVST